MAGLNSAKKCGKIQNVTSSSDLEIVFPEMYALGCPKIQGLSKKGTTLSMVIKKELATASNICVELWMMHFIKPKAKSASLLFLLFN